MAGFTDRMIASLRSETRKDVFTSDPKQKGLAIRVSPTGQKSWVFHYTFASRRTRLTLGSYPAVSVREAGLRAVECRGCLDESPPRDPGAMILARKASEKTVAGLIDGYCSHIQTKGLRSADKMARALRREVVPIIGHIPLASLHRRDINTVIDRIAERGTPIAARRTFTLLYGLFSWAVGRGDLEVHPMEHMERSADFTPRDRVLTLEELGTFWRGLDKALESTLRRPVYAPVLGRLLRFCLVTGCRVGEAAGLTRAEIKDGVWTLPPERSKNKHPHVLPLSPLALELIGDGDGAIFGGFRSGFVSDVFTKLPAALGLPHFSAHDLRRSCADHMADLGVSQLVIGHVLNHRSITRASVTTRHYVVRGYLPEVREAQALWDARLRSVMN